MQRRFLSAVLLIAYCAILVRLLVFENVLFRIGHLRFRFGSQEAGGPNFWPFATILRYLRGEHGWLISAVNLGGNILLFAPLGFLAPLVLQRMTWRGSLVLAVSAGLVIEGMEAAFGVGVFDVDDLLLNALGVMIGYCALSIFHRRARPAQPA